MKQTLFPNLDDLRAEHVLVQAWKKTATYLRQHSWYADTLELDYQFNPSPWLSIQPDAQYIIDRAGNSNNSDILVLGLRTIVRF